MSYVDFSDLNGKKLISIKGLHKHSDEILFKTECGATYIMDHEYCCCESVLVEDFDVD